MQGGNDLEKRKEKEVAEGEQAMVDKLLIHKSSLTLSTSKKGFQLAGRRGCALRRSIRRALRMISKGYGTEAVFGQEKS